MDNADRPTKANAPEPTASAALHAAAYNGKSITSIPFNKRWETTAVVFNIPSANRSGENTRVNVRATNVQTIFCALEDSSLHDVARHELFQTAAADTVGRIPGLCVGHLRRFLRRVATERTPHKGRYPRHVIAHGTQVAARQGSAFGLEPRPIELQ